MAGLQSGLHEPINVAQVVVVAVVVEAFDVLGGCPVSIDLRIAKCEHVDVRHVAMVVNLWFLLLLQAWEVEKQRLDPFQMEWKQIIDEVMLASELGAFPLALIEIVEDVGVEIDEEVEEQCDEGDSPLQSG